MTYQKPKNYFKLLRLILTICGLSLTPKKTITYKIYSLFLLTTIILAYPILDTYELFKHDFETALRIFVCQTFTLTAAAKAVVVLINRKKIHAVLQKLEETPFLPNPNRGGKEEEKLIHQCVRTTNIQTYLCLGFTSVFVPIFCLGALGTRMGNKDYHKWLLPYGPFTVLDVTHSPDYEITFLYQASSMILLSEIFVTTDLIIAGVLAHISYQLKILQNFLRNIVEYSRKVKMLQEGPSSPLTKIDWKYLNKSIKDAVQYHVAILELAKEMEEIFRYVFFATFLSTMAMMSLDVFQISFEKFDSGVIQYLVEYVDASFTVAILCYWGDQILSEGGKVGDAALESNYIGTDFRFQRSLVMIIRRSQIPIKLTAGRIAKISMDTCLWIWKQSYAVYMVLRNVDKN